MLNHDLKLNTKHFEKDIEFASMRKGFGDGLVLAGEKDKRVVALCADLDESVQMESFKKKFPERFVQIGVAEQNLVTVASGMASMGKIPFVGSYAVFSPGRNWEQIRTTICYNNVPVKIIGSHVGLNVGVDGGSHQALEDIAMMRVLPRMVVISPCDAIQAKKATQFMAKTDEPTCMRLVREKSQVMTTEETPFEIGKAQIYFDSRFAVSANVGIQNKKIDSRSRENDAQLDVGIIATGPLLFKALLTARKLDAEGKKVAVMNLSTIKPLDENAIIKLAHEARAIVTVEEHQIAGGMGSAVAECLAQHFPVPIEFVGVKDTFGQSGTPEELSKYYGLDEKNIYEAVQRVMVRKL